LCTFLCIPLYVLNSRPKLWSHLLILLEDWKWKYVCSLHDGNKTEWHYNVDSCAKVAIVLGSIPASFDTEKSEGRQKKQWWKSTKNLKNPPKIYRMLRKESIEWFLEYWTFSRSYDLAPPQPPHPLSRQQARLATHRKSKKERQLAISLWRGRRGGGWGDEGVREEPNHTCARKSGPLWIIHYSLVEHHGPGSLPNMQLSSSRPFFDSNS
jgi:hypothetical protein